MTLENLWLRILRIGVVLMALYWLAHRSLDHSVFYYTLLAACILSLCFMVFIPRDKLGEWADPPSGAVFFHDRLWGILGAAALAATLAYLERMQPYYFTQDDSHSQFLPTIIFTARGLFNEGVFSSWNGYQLMGVPTATLGYHSLTYPITYLSYAFARFVLGNEFMTMEVFAWAHLLFGYGMSFLCMRRLNIRPSVSASAALGFALLGFNLIAGRSWYYMITPAAWLPVFAWSLIALMQKGPSGKWVFWTAIAIGLYFHAGNAQLWVYACMMWGAGILWILLCRQKEFILYASSAAMATLSGLAIAMPLAVVQAIETRYIPRFQGGASIGDGLRNMLLPWPLVSSPHPWGQQLNAGTFFFSGGVYIFGCFLYAAFYMAYFARGKITPRQSLLACFPLIAMLAFILALGEEGRLWDWLAPYPPFSRFRIPFKVLPFVIFFMTLCGALMAEKLLRHCHRALIEPCVTLLAGGLAVFNAAHCIAAFWHYPDIPYPTLPVAEEMFQANEFSMRGRLHPFTFWPPHDAGYVLALDHNYPSLYDIPVISGYHFGNLELGLPQNRRATDLFYHDRNEFYHTFGVDWVLVSNLPHEPRPLSPRDLVLLRQHSSKVVDVGVAEAFYIHDDETAPMAFDNLTRKPLPYRIRPDGVEIDVSSYNAGWPTRIIANFLARKWFRAYTESGEELKVGRDNEGRVAIVLLHPAKILSLRYCPPWSYGLYVGLAMMLLVAGLGAFTRLYLKSAETVEEPE